MSYVIMRGSQRMTTLQAKALVDFTKGKFEKTDKRFKIVLLAIDKIKASIVREPKKISKPIDKRKKKRKVKPRQKVFLEQNVIRGLFNAEESHKKEGH